MKRIILTEIAKSESDLKKNVMFKMNEESSPMMVYEGIIDSNHAFMHEFVKFGNGPILSWRNDGKLTFSEEGIKLGEDSCFEIYEYTNRVYDKKKKIIEEATKYDSK
jgi:hypothetical protein